MTRPNTAAAYLPTTHAIAPGAPSASPYGASPRPHSAQPYAYSGPGGLSGVAAARHLPDNPSHDEKVRFTFDQLDANSNRVVERDEMLRGLRRCGLDFTTSTSADLFQKADTDGDGVVNFAEWQRFAELYPTLLDCIYYRFKAHWEHVTKEQQVDAMRTSRAPLEEGERAAEAQYRQSQLDAEDLNRRLQDADRSAGEAANRVRTCEDEARDGAREADRVRQQRADRERDMAAERERERQGQLRAQESAKEVDAAQRQLAGAQAQMQDAEAAEQRAAQMLADTRRERERAASVVERAAGDANRAVDRHNQVLGELPRGLDEAAARLQAADRDLQSAEGKAREMAAKAGDTARNADDLARQRDAQGAALQHVRDQQEPARLAWLEAQAAVEEHDRRVAEMEAALAADAEGRRNLDDHERGLVEQELRLREQREALEEKEGHLRSSHHEFHQVAGRSSPARGRTSAGASPAAVGPPPVGLSQMHYASTAHSSAAAGYSVTYGRP